MRLTHEQVRDRLRVYAAEFAQLCGQAGVNRRDLLMGTETHHGLNHLNELCMMLGESAGRAEFAIRE